MSSKLPRFTLAVAVVLVLIAPLRGQSPLPAAPGAGTSPAPVGGVTRPGSARVPPAPAPAASQDQYKIGPEDTLEISVWKNTDLTRTVVVRPDGRISLPLLNDLQASGLTALQLRDILVKGYAAFQPEPEVSVIVREIHSIKVSVLGGVKTPGRYELKSQATVLEALAMAGGFTDFAKRDQIVVMRRTSKGWSRLPFNYARVTGTGDEENYFVQSGDIIVVPN